MATRNFRSQFVYNWHAFPVHLDCTISFAGSSAPTLISTGTIFGSNPTASMVRSQGIVAVTRLAVGQYQIQLADNYTDLYSLQGTMRCNVTGSAVAGGAFVTGKVYQIVTVGTTTQAQWVTAGLSPGLAAAAGQIFVAVGAGAGNGTVKEIAPPNTGYSIVQMGGSTVNLSYQPYVQGTGGYINFGTIGPTTPGTSSADATPAFKDPDSGTIMLMSVLLSNSSLG